MMETMLGMIPEWAAVRFLSIKCFDAWNAVQFERDFQRSQNKHIKAANPSRPRGHALLQIEPADCQRVTTEIQDAMSTPLTPCPTPHHLLGNICNKSDIKTVELPMNIRRGQGKRDKESPHLSNVSSHVHLMLTQNSRTTGLESQPASLNSNTSSCSKNLTLTEPSSVDASFETTQQFKDTTSKKTSLIPSFAIIAQKVGSSQTGNNINHNASIPIEQSLARQCTVQVLNARRKNPISALGTLKNLECPVPSTFLDTSINRNENTPGTEIDLIQSKVHPESSEKEAKRIKTESLRALNSTDRFQTLVPRAKSTKNEKPVLHGPSSADKEREDARSQLKSSSCLQKEAVRRDPYGVSTALSRPERIQRLIKAMGNTLDITARYFIYDRKQRDATVAGHPDITFLDLLLAQQQGKNSNFETFCNFSKESSRISDNHTLTTLEHCPPHRRSGLAVQTPLDIIKLLLKPTNTSKHPERFVHGRGLGVFRIDRAPAEVDSNETIAGKGSCLTLSQRRYIPREMPFLIGDEANRFWPSQRAYLDTPPGHMLIPNHTCVGLRLARDTSHPRWRQPAPDPSELYATGPSVKVPAPPTTKCV